MQFDCCYPLGGYLEILLAAMFIDSAGGVRAFTCLQCTTNVRNASGQVTSAGNFRWQVTSAIRASVQGF